MQGKLKRSAYIQWAASLQGTKGPVFASYTFGSKKDQQGHRTINWDWSVTRVQACQGLYINLQMASKRIKCKQKSSSFDWRHPGCTHPQTSMQRPKRHPTSKCFSRRNQPLNWVCTLYKTKSQSNLQHFVAILTQTLCGHPAKSTPTPTLLVL